MPTKIQPQWALITGASSGIGKEFAHALAERGHNLVLVARRADPMHTLADDLRARHSIQVLVEPTDLTAPNAATLLKQSLDARSIPIHTLINNAGFGLIGEFLTQPADQIQSMLRLNVAALTDLTHVFANAMHHTGGGGRILLVASVAAYQPCPLYASYAATKAYVLSFGAALHAELAPHNITVTVLSPGVTESEFFDVAGAQPSAPMRRMMMKARPVVEIGLKALDRGQSTVVAGTMNRLMTLSTRFLSRALTARIGYKLLKQ